MLKLSRRAEYALLVITYLGRLPSGSKATVAEIARAEQAPAGLLAKVMQGLKRAGLLTSTKGVSGGYTLRRPLDKILLLDVIRPFEEYMAMSRCSDAEISPCDREDICALRDPMNALNDFVMRQLQTITMISFTQMEFSAQATANACTGCGPLIQDSSSTRQGRSLLGSDGRVALTTLLSPEKQRSKSSKR